MREEFTNLGQQYRADATTIIDQFTRERTANIGLFREQMGRAQADYTRYFDEARTQYAAGMERAIGEMRTGRDATIQMMRQQTEAQQRAATSRAAFTGLGQTTFGQQRIEGIGTQGALREAALREQYASQLSALEAQRAGGMSTLSAQMGQGLGAMGQAQAGGMSALYQQYSQGIASAQQTALNNQYAMIQQGLNIQSGFRGQAAQLSGAAWAPLGQMLGSFAGGFTGAAGTNLGNSFVPPPPGG
jgi:hypothetical protein